MARRYITIAEVAEYLQISDKTVPTAHCRR
jgi:hypothetical protein